MKTITNNSNYELIINKSKFIGYLYKVETIDEINNILKELKTKYSDATHICYAYSLMNSKKAFDDGEPSKTAGIPILEVLNKNDLVNVLGIVIRYFGGIKLGSGGLIRAYSNTIRDTLLKTEIKELTKGYIIKITTNYQNNNIVYNLLENHEIISKEFNEDITYLVKGDDPLILKLNNQNIPHEIIKHIYL